MNKKILITGFCWLLGACVTTPNEPPPPIKLTSGNGVMAMNVTVDQAAAKNYYIFNVAQFDPGTRRVIMEGDSPKHGATFRQSFGLQDAGVGFWKSELPAGHYAITNIQAKFATGLGSGQVPYGTDPLALLLVGLTVIAISEATVDELSFINESGLLLADAPTFKIESGRASYLGKIRVTSDTKSADFPEYDKEGQLDGVSMITKTQFRYMADYGYDERCENTSRKNDETYHSDHRSRAACLRLPDDLHTAAPDPDPHGQGLGRTQSLR